MAAADAAPIEDRDAQAALRQVGAVDQRQPAAGEDDVEVERARRDRVRAPTARADGAQIARSSASLGEAALERVEVLERLRRQRFTPAILPHARARASAGVGRPGRRQRRRARRREAARGSARATSSSLRGSDT